MPPIWFTNTRYKIQKIDKRLIPLRSQMLLMWQMIFVRALPISGVNLSIIWHERVAINIVTE